MIGSTAPRFTEQRALHRQNLPGAGHYDQDAACGFGSPESDRSASPTVELVPAKKLPRDKRVVFGTKKADGLDEAEYPGPGKYFPQVIEKVCYRQSNNNTWCNARETV